MPAQYFPDVSPPIPLKWFYDRSTTAFIIIFSEPIRIVNCFGFHISYGLDNFTIEQCTPQYSNFGTRLSISIPQTIFRNVTSQKVLIVLGKSSPGELQLGIKNATVSDIGVSQNLIADWLLRESSPGAALHFLFSICAIRLFALSSRIISIFQMYFIT